MVETEHHIADQGIPKCGVGRKNSDKAAETPQLVLGIGGYFQCHFCCYLVKIREEKAGAFL